jgi:ubiquinone/menaquinone biosynthesis C-methylase UbiE
MSSPTLTEWERIEAERSAAEASHIDTARLVANETQVARYLNPPAETCYPLEYSYHLLGDVRGKVVLEYGCGDGLNTLALARRGARVKALDISPELIGVARRRLQVNHLDSDVEFIVGSAHDLPLEDESVDVVFGIAILHHLDLKLSAREVRRVLRKGGRAIFQEPVRNSGFVKFVRNLIPYTSPDVSPFERPLSDRELAEYADGYSSYRSKAFTLPTTNLVNILPSLERRIGDACYRWDAAVLRALPPLAHFATVRVVEMVK